MTTIAEITKGSAKQTAWAEDVRARWIESLDRIMAPYYKAANGNETVIARLDGSRDIVIAELCGSDDASHYIDLDVKGYWPDFGELLLNAAKQYTAK